MCWYGIWDGAAIPVQGLIITQHSLKQAGDVQDIQVMSAVQGSAVSPLCFPPTEEDEGDTHFPLAFGAAMA